MSDGSSLVEENGPQPRQRRQRVAAVIANRAGMITPRGWLHLSRSNPNTERT